MRSGRGECLDIQLDAATVLERKRRKRRRVIRVAAAWFLAVFLVLVLAAGAAAVYMAVGGNSLRNRAGNKAPHMGTEANETASGAGRQNAREESALSGGNAGVVWKEGWVRYDGKIYEYNEDILNFLVMGIDKNGKVADNPDAVSGGQADALFIVSANPHTKDLSIIAVNRDTMTDIKMYGYPEKGYEQTTRAQIATQHGFGDGRKVSCELTRDAVSALFYDLPIHGYVAVNMAAIESLNDAVGGVKVTVLEDMTKLNGSWKEGSQVTLEGRDAFRYVKWRDTEVFESNRGRLARQKQYLTAFVQKAVAETKKDITLPVKLYGKLEKYMVTDITVQEAAYMAGELLEYHFDGDAIYTMEGKTRMGEKHEEFYPDYEAQKALMIRVFYEEADVRKP